jgi:transcriptional regulator with PAS, ATPase and Fis domain
MAESPQPVEHCFLGMPAVVRSARMQHLLEIVPRVAQTPASVLVTGESGSGKELIARAIHHYSLRGQKPWVDVNCAALPDHLVESELFGYEKGAFSGADAPKQGLFELAHQGTLFLDEIGELDPKMQVKLLRVLDNAPYYRLGGVRKITVDVRVLAATNQNLEDMVAHGRFRSDLYHRLNQVTLEVPPLRTRLDDIVPLARYFLAQMNPQLEFSYDAREALEGYHWPGNVRELRNVVTKSAIFAEGSLIRASDLPAGFGSRPATNGPVHPASNRTADLDSLERHQILRILAETGGHHQRAAERLGISRRTLSRKLKLYAMEQAEPAGLSSVGSA